MEDTKSWFKRYEDTLNKECKFSSGDRVLVSQEVIDEMAYLPEVHEALKNGTRLGTVGMRTQSLYNGGKEPLYVVVLDDCGLKNVQYNESELSLETPVELSALDKAILLAEANLLSLKDARAKLWTRLTK